MSENMQNTIFFSSIKIVFCICVSFFLQLLIGSCVWRLCSEGKVIPKDKNLNIVFNLPQEYDEFPNEIREVLQKPEEEALYEISKIEMEVNEEIIDNPFDNPLVLDVPVIDNPKPTPTKKDKKIKENIKKEIPKQIESVKQNTEKIVQKQEIKDAGTVKEIISTPVEDKKDLITKQSKPSLTKSQLNENTKYLGKVLKVFEKNKKYPSEARKKHIEGKIIVSFYITADGKTKDVISKTTQLKTLSDAAVMLVKNASLPIPPKHWIETDRVEIPITYKIK